MSSPWSSRAGAVSPASTPALAAPVPAFIPDLAVAVTYVPVLAPALSNDLNDSPQFNISSAETQFKKQISQ